MHPDRQHCICNSAHDTAGRATPYHGNALMWLARTEQLCWNVVRVALRGICACWGNMVTKQHPSGLCYTSTCPSDGHCHPLGHEEIASLGGMLLPPSSLHSQQHDCASALTCNVLSFHIGMPVKAGASARHSSTQDAKRNSTAFSSRCPHLPAGLRSHSLQQGRSKAVASCSKQPAPSPCRSHLVLNATPPSATHCDLVITLQRCAKPLTVLRVGLSRM